MLLLAGTATVEAQNTDVDKLADLTWAEMINSVDLGKTANLVKEFQEKEARGVLLRKGSPYADASNGCRVESYRRKEVLLITIPASDLFAPNDTVLKPGADKFLMPVRRYLKTPDMWRVMLVMHTDNTGSELYRDRITEMRVMSIYDWFENQSGVDTDYLFPYSLSDDAPLKNNNTMENRAKNRRLEIYLVPGEKMVQRAKSGRLAY